MKKIAILIDGSNAYAAAKALNFQIDYKKFLSYFRKTYEVSRAFYFTALPPKDVQSTLRPMVTFLEHNEYTVIQKETKEYIDLATNLPKIKGNMDCEIAVYGTKYAQLVDEIVLFSGDADFRCVVERIQELGTRVSILSTLKGQVVSDALRRQADAFIELADLRSYVEYLRVTVDNRVAPRRFFPTLGGN